MSINNIPKTIGFTVGRNPGNSVADADMIGIVKRVGDRSQPLFGRIENYGLLPFTFSVQQSSDNAVADAYAGLNIRVGGASVASVVVPAKCSIVFIIEGAAEDYLRFISDPEEDAFGLLSLAYWFCEMQQCFRSGVL